MHPHRLIAGFFLRLIAIYALLIAVWPLVWFGYGAALSAVSNVAFGELGAATVRFEPSTESSAGAAYDLTLVLRNKRTAALGRLPVSSFYYGYVPTALLAALTLATPIRWPRRMRALLGGLALVHAFIAFRLALLLVSNFSGTDLLATFSLGRAGDATISFFAELLASSLTGCYIVPVLLWIITTLRPDALQQIVCNARPAADGPAPSSG
ncbi:MAG: hypothetical protein L0Y44_15645 [Phycisphaerales bacterium]|nr:hypothetical protein [Phycisphaerales bacterium]MCI0676369.1 hypothetical protein [Phycisphaerales bacterium]